jgi:tetratricopeptide (TPR) repeat protein
MNRFTLAAVALAVALSGAACKSSPKRPTGLAQAQSAYDAGEFDKCVTLCTAAIDSGADPGAAHLLRGKAYEKGGDAVRAIADYEKVRRSDPTRGEAACRQARCHLSLGQYDQAETVMEWMLSQVYDSLSARDQMFAHAVYGEVNLAMGNFPRAIEAFERSLKVARSSRALAADPAAAIVHYNLSRAQFERNSFKKAREAFVGYVDVKRRGGGEFDADDGYTLAVLHFLCGDIRNSRELAAKLPSEHQARMNEVLSGEAFSVRALYDQTRPDKEPNE